ncbi:MAG: spore coat associated protein CotJA [Clostridia bacterium]|nr:spore coat associated protein CotJA [Clostridia bacterium]
MRNRNMNRRRNMMNHMCGRNCRELPVMPDDPQLANAYVPYQYADDLLCPKDSLENGTTFPELVSPYSKNQSQCVIAFLSQTETCEEVDPCE